MALGQRQLCAQDACLVLAFGGAGGGYRNEHCSHAVGLLHEAGQQPQASIHWGWPRSQGSALPTPRASHTSTYVPARLAGAHYPEGCVVVLGGHTDDTTEVCITVDVLRLHDWQWSVNKYIGGSSPRARLGHEAILVESDGRAYLVVTGGGLGSILSPFGTQEMNDVAVMDLHAWVWLGALHLRRAQGVPVPGRHHTACAGLGGQLFLFGGGHSPSNKLCVLDGVECVRRAHASAREIVLREVPTASEQRMPRGRKMHGAACLLPWLPAFVIFGGWETQAHFEDIWVCALGREENLLQLRVSVTVDESEEEDDSEDERAVMLRLMGVDRRRLPPHLLQRLMRNRSM